jgi:hypothetical protein
MMHGDSQRDRRALRAAISHFEAPVDLRDIILVDHGRGGIGMADDCCGVWGKNSG